MFHESPRLKLCRRGSHSSGFCGLWIEIESLWGQRSKGLDPVALLRSAMTGPFPVNLFDYKNGKIPQGVALGVKMSSYRFFQTSMFNIRSMAIHTYVERILRFSNILFIAFCTFDHIDHIRCFAICRGFDGIYCPSDRALKPFYRFDVFTRFTTCMLAPGIPLVR